MGDVPGSDQRPGSFPTSTPDPGRHDPWQLTPVTTEQQDSQDQISYNIAVAGPERGYSSLHSPFPQQFCPDYNSLRMSPLQSNMAPTQSPSRSLSFGMASLSVALPDMNYVQPYTQQHPQRFSPGPSNTVSLYPLQGNPQLPEHPTVNQLHGSQYNVQYPQPYQGMYNYHQVSTQVQQSGPVSQHQYVNNQNFVGLGPPQHISQYYYPPPAGSFPHVQSASYKTSPLSPYPIQYGGRSNLPGDACLVGQSQVGNENPRTTALQGGGGGVRSSSIAPISGQSSVPRGPPRKPKQSGHALWVGNLPPTATVIDLRDHFSREATKDILSVFLISKSNCAFINYKTAESCSAAMHRFHDSRFQGVRLVCRLRRSSVIDTPNVPTGPAALFPSRPAVVRTPDADEAETVEADKLVDRKEKSTVSARARDKYFVVKSLTVEDLELSVRNGVWATQSHNEETLNKAYETADLVYLIFSANKSGEYFGYARMMSSINGDQDITVESAPRPQGVEESDLPKAIPTAPSDWAPKGRIIDDSARGTIFWEAESDEDEGTADFDENGSENNDHEADDINTRTWGKPFKIEWISTNRLPFYRTRGIRNPWNSNREVKIARDGTELETAIGRRLVAMFHREASPVTPAIPQIMGNHPPVRPY